jgi:hypothetical protein
MAGAIPMAPADFDPTHRDMLERWAACGCVVSRYMLDHKLWFPEALGRRWRRCTASAALSRRRCRTKKQ